MIVPDAPRPQAPVDPQVASASQAAQDPKDLELIDEQSRRLGALQGARSSRRQVDCFVNFMRMKAKSGGSIQQTEMLEFLREYRDQFLRSSDEPQPIWIGSLLNLEGS